MKKYKCLYEEEKKQHEEAPQRYQEDHLDEMGIISLHKSVARERQLQRQPQRPLKVDTTFS